MRNLTVTICLTIAVLLGSAGVSESADYQKGLEAYTRKDYKTAYIQFYPIAKQGNLDARRFIGWCLTSAPMEQISGIA